MECRQSTGDRMRSRAPSSAWTGSQEGTVTACWWRTTAAWSSGPSGTRGHQLLSTATSLTSWAAVERRVATSLTTLGSCGRPAGLTATGPSPPARTAMAMSSCGGCPAPPSQVPARPRADRSWTPGSSLWPPCGSPATTAPRALPPSASLLTKPSLCRAGRASWSQRGCPSFESAVQRSRRTGQIPAGSPTWRRGKYAQR
mmetsp:Transcript_1397/g.4027  ORF Transcript_1397/g.4027 Transcript_1397/m.4027 type:complete len:200 (+) Transcript_1397:753-1352(+)